MFTVALLSASCAEKNTVNYVITLEITALLCNRRTYNTYLQYDNASR